MRKKLDIHFSAVRFILDCAIGLNSCMYLHVDAWYVGLYYAYKKDIPNAVGSRTVQGLGEVISRRSFPHIVQCVEATARTCDLSVHRRQALPLAPEFCWWDLLMISISFKKRFACDFAGFLCSEILVIIYVFLINYGSAHTSGYFRVWLVNML